MIPYELDPSLHTAPPRGEALDDGFSPRAATHPVEPEPEPQKQPDPGSANPSHLPVEPEFGHQLPPADAENPQPPPPKI